MWMEEELDEGGGMGGGRLTPQCFASFICVVSSASVLNEALHHTHLRTSFVASWPLLSQ